MDLKLIENYMDIPFNTKIVAFFGDGSGATLFHVIDHKIMIDAEGVEYDTDYLEDHYIFWSCLPDDFYLWYEKK